ncbi:hypothetical protein BDA99DRAFT_497500 [Phascolomyces articulosus]|uniref:Epidermal growth factor receptor-like transmembrane-juxtamembrane segment domain-containing protein n=1 Tax=Phascolomyces articulosus TaxID=60185 RepID=A0AAD5PIH3_9FUNG|nr:hypothetical protein BDA99DRAFT_497500 [Phascolomyces articulosus]
MSDVPPITLPEPIPTTDTPPPSTTDEPPPSTTDEPPPSTTSDPQPSPTPTTTPNEPDPTSTPGPDPTTPDPTTPDPQPTTTGGGEDPTTTRVTTTTTDDDQPTSTPDNPSDNSSLPTPTTSPDEQPTSDNTPPPSSSSEVHVTSVVSSGTHVYTITSTSYTMIPPTETGSTGGESNTNTGAIAGGVVGGVAFIGILGALAFFLLRRRRKQNRKSTGGFGDLDDPYGNYPDMAAAGPMSPGGSSSPGGGSSNARPLVAPLRPASKIGEEDPNMTYAAYRDPSPGGAYYEDTSPHTSAHYSQPSTGVPSTGGVPAYYTHDEYGNYPPQQQQQQQYYQSTGYWAEGSSDGGDRHVPHLVEGQQVNDVPHSRQ